MYSGTSVSLLKNKNIEFNVELEKESIVCVIIGSKNPSLVITICHHEASLVMPNDDPQDGFFNRTGTLTLLRDSYNLPVKKGQKDGYLPEASHLEGLLAQVLKKTKN